MHKLVGLAIVTTVCSLLTPSGVAAQGADYYAQLERSATSEATLAVLEADILLHAGRPDSAEAGYRAVLLQAPDNLDAQVGLVEALRHQGRWDEAAAEAGQLPADALQHLDEQATLEVLPLLAQARALSPDQRQKRIVQIADQLNAGAGKRADAGANTNALAFLPLLYQVSEQPPALKVRLVAALSSASERALAAELERRTGNPDSAAYGQYLVALIALGWGAEAEVQHARLIQLAGSGAQSLQGLAETRRVMSIAQAAVLQRNGGFEKAYELITTQLAEAPDSEELLVAMADLYAQSAHAEPARQLYGYALERYPSSERALAGAVESNLNLGSPDRAAALLRQYAAPDTTSLTLQWLSARVAREQGDVTQAQRILSDTHQQLAGTGSVGWKRRTVDGPDLANANVVVAMAIAPPEVPARVYAAELPVPLSTASLAMTPVLASSAAAVEIPAADIAPAAASELPQALPAPAETPVPSPLPASVPAVEDSPPAVSFLAITSAATPAVAVQPRSSPGSAVLFDESWSSAYLPGDAATLTQQTQVRLEELSEALENQQDFYGVYVLLEQELNAGNGRNGGRYGVHWELLNNGWRQSRISNEKRRLDVEFEQLQVLSSLQQQDFDSFLFALNKIRNAVRLKSYEKQLRLYEALSPKKQQQLDDGFITLMAYERFVIRKATVLTQYELYSSLDRAGLPDPMRALLNRIEDLRIKTSVELMALAEQNSLELKKARNQVSRAEYAPDYWDNASLRLFVEQRDRFQGVNISENVVGVRVQLPVAFASSDKSLVDSQKQNFLVNLSSIKARLAQQFASLTQQYQTEVEALNMLFVERQALQGQMLQYQELAEVGLATLEQNPEQDAELLDIDVLAMEQKILEKRLDCVALLSGIAWLLQTEEMNVVN